MSFGTMVDVAIGLALTYLLVSLMVTSLQETLTSILATRGKTLNAGLKKLLEPNGAAAGTLSALTSALLKHPLIQPTDAKRPPSYIPTRNFSLAMLDVLADGSATPLVSQVERGIANLPGGSTKTALLTFVQHAGGDLDTLKSHLETWFDDSMDRVAGTYRRNAQLLAFAMGLVLAMVLNVDSFRIAELLYRNSDLRQTAASLASMRVATGQPPTANIDAKALLDDAGKLPIGWDCPGPARYCGRQAIEGRTPQVWEVVSNTVLPWKSGMLPWLVTISGWLTAAVAMSLGAPFWFDMLQRLFNLRGAGPKPAATTTPSKT